MNEQEKHQEAKQETTRKKKKLSVSHVLSGGILTEDFIVKQSKLLIMISILCILFIANRYDCLKKIAEIEKLSQELNNVKYENLVISTELTSNSRQSQIESLIESRGLGLTGSKNPAFEIKK